MDIKNNFMENYFTYLPVEIKKIIFKNIPGWNAEFSIGTLVLGIPNNKEFKVIDIIYNDRVGYEYCIEVLEKPVCETPKHLYWRTKHDLLKITD